MTKAEKEKFLTELNEIERDLSAGGGRGMFVDGPLKAGVVQSMAMRKLLALIAKILLALN